MKKWTRANYQPGIPLNGRKERITACKEHIAISKEAAKEGMVLLKNECGLLPLQVGKRVALFGKGTVDYVKGGGGSGDVTVSYVRNLAEGMRLLDENAVFPDTIAYYQREMEQQYAAGRMPGMTAEPEIPSELLERAKAFTDTAIISISRFSGEGWDRKCSLDRIEKHLLVDENAVRMSDEIFERGDYYLSEAENKMVETVTNAFANVIVVLNVGAVMDVFWFHENPKIQAVLMAWQGGMEGGLAAAELLLGMGTPSGKLADTFARDLEDYPSTAGFYESEDYVDYIEDIYVGYRYFETIPGAAEKVVYPFGYGLSYTAFAITEQEAQIDREAGTVTVSAMVENTGRLPGREVVQVYYSAPQGKLGKPARELAGYQKTKLLTPRERQRVRISFAIRDMASYDDLGKVQKSAYVLEKGEYRFFLGTDVKTADPMGEALVLEEDQVTQQLSPQMVPAKLRRRMVSDGSFEELPMQAGEALGQLSAEEQPDQLAGEFPGGEGGFAMQRLKDTELEFPLPETRGIPSRQKRVNEYVLEDVYLGKISLEDFTRGLPDEDLVCLLGGQPNTGVANTFGYGNQDLNGIPNIMTADGPAGLRIMPECGVVTTAFPCSTLLACTWDPAVTERVGAAAGAEVKENNIGVWLAPAVCIHRNPLCGRNFEYYSEDPLLTARQAGAMVRGIQSNRIAATVKHFALNNKESNRKNSDSRASERAIREIYLKAFERIVRENEPWSIMSSYNIINGCRASENKDLLTNILREEWGYQGMVTSDWWTFGEHYLETAAGNDMRMPCGYPGRLLEAKEKGLISREQMETSAMRILNLILKLD